MHLASLPARRTATIATIEWGRLVPGDARRLKELGFDEGVSVETLHRGPLGADPIACRVGRMTVAIRRAAAQAVIVEAA